MELVLFWIFAIGAVACALLVILPPLARNPLYSALSLVGAFVFLAAIYVLLVAHLVAVLQLLVYAGAIMVLFIFVIMLLNLRPDDLTPARITPARVLGAVAAVFVVTRLSMMLVPGVQAPPADISQPLASAIQSEAVAYGTVKHVGQALFSHFLVPFELLSLVLLVAIIGAVVLARKPLAPADDGTGPVSDGQEAS